MNQQVIGQITGMEQRNAGWVAVSILEAGKQYPKKLSTKREDLIGLAQQMMGQLVTAAYNEQLSDQINPHNGQPYTNRYLEALSLGAVDLVGMPTQIQPQQYMPQQPQPQQQYAPQPQPQPVQQQPVMQQQPQPHPTGTIQHVVTSDAVREAKIHRQSAAKVSVELLQYLDPAERNLASLVRISEQLCQYFESGVQWTTPPVQPQQPQAQQPMQQQPQQQQQPQGYENPGEYGPQYPATDDDIPF